MESSYIAYLDLLGIKELARYKAEKYSEAMTKFTEKLFLAASKIPEHVNIDKFKIYFFSDCAFIESEKIEILFNFFIDFRTYLTEDDPAYYFTAAVTEGRLEPFSIFGGKNPSNTPDIAGLDGNTKAALLHGAYRYVRGTVFKSNTISPVYLMQHNFKGIGIMVDKRVSLAKPGLSKFLSESFYFPGLGYDRIETYFDIRLSPIELTEARMNVFFELYHKANKRNKKYGKYYFSMLINWINSVKIKSNISVSWASKEEGTESRAATPADKKNKDVKEEKMVRRNIAVFQNLPPLFDLLLNFENHIIQELAAEAYHFELTYFFILHKLNMYQLDQWITIGFIQRIKSLPSCRKHFNNIDAIPDPVFNYEDKEMFIAQYSEMIKAGKLNDQMRKVQSGKR